MKKHARLVAIFLLSPGLSLASPCGPTDVTAVIEAFEASAVVKKEAQEKVSRGLKPACVRTVTLGQTCGDTNKCGTKFLVVQSFNPTSREKNNTENILAFTVQSNDGKVFVILRSNLILNEHGTHTTILE